MHNDLINDLDSDPEPSPDHSTEPKKQVEKVDTDGRTGFRLK
jgi:hypothetical protein